MASPFSRRFAKSPWPASGFMDFAMKNLCLLGSHRSCVNTSPCVSGRGMSRIESSDYCMAPGGGRCSTSPRSSVRLRFLAVDVVVGAGTTAGSAVGGEGELLVGGANGAYSASMDGRD